MRIVTRPASRALLHIGIGLALAVVAICGATALRILFGPISLGMLTPVVEASLNRGMSEYRVAIGDSVLRWSRADWTLDLRFVDVALTSRDGALLASVPEMEVGLSARALLRGLIAPAEVAIFRPAATLVRREDGRVQLGFSQDNEDGVVQGSDRFFNLVLTVLREAPNRKTQTGYLKRFIIRDATLTFYDRATDTMWRAPNAVLSFARGADGLDAKLEAAMVSGKKRFLVSAQGTLERAADLFHLTAKLEGFIPAHVAAKSRLLTPLKTVTGPLQGEISATLTGKGAVKAGHFNVTMGRGRILLPGLSTVALDVASAEAIGRFDAESESIVLERFAYDAGRNKAFATGRVKLLQRKDGTLAGLRFDLDAKDLSVDLPKLFSAHGRFPLAALRGGVDFASRTLRLDEAVLTSGSAKLSLKGTVVEAPGAPALQLTGSIDHLPFADLAKIWPIGSAEGARAWIVRNVPRGVIPSGTLTVDVPAGALAAPRLPDEAVRLAFTFEELELSYIRGLTPITQGRGHAILWGNRFELWLEGGRIDELAVSNGTFTVADLSTTGEAGEIALNLKGRTASLLRVLDMQPLGYPTQFGIDPNAVGGEVDARLSVRVPLLDAVGWDEIGFRAEAALTDFAVEAPYRDFAITKGTLAMTIGETGLKAKGDVLLGGYPAMFVWSERFGTDEALPTTFSISTTLDAAGRARAIGGGLDEYIDGPTPISLVLNGQGAKVRQIGFTADLTQAALQLTELNYRKEKGEKGALTFALALAEDGTLSFRDVNLTASGLDIRGLLTVADDGRLLSASFNPLRAGPGTEAVLSAARDDKDSLNLTIKGKSLDLSKAMDSLSEAWREASGKKGASLSIAASLDRLYLAHGVRMRDVSLRYAQTTERLTALSLNGALNDRSRVVAELSPDLAGRRRLKVESQDAGALLSGFALTSNVVGGTFDLDVTLSEPGAAQEAPGGGTLRMTNFRVVKAPALAKLFAVGSLTGMGDLLNGEGIAFERLEAPFTLANGTITLSRAQAYGPAVGLTLQGSIPRAKGEMDLTGTLVPAYTLNTFLGYVPVFGTLLTSRAGEGVLGFTYSVSGDPSDPRVFVNPLSAFAPGVLRRIFQIDEEAQAKRPVAPTEAPVVPQ